MRFETIVRLPKESSSTTRAAVASRVPVPVHVPIPAPVPAPASVPAHAIAAAPSRHTKDLVFVVKPEIQNDIYNLYCADGSLFEVAYIPNFTTSVMMNKLFRNIKENSNLDALEESDDEEEFESDKPDQFVFLDRSFRMVCSFNHKFKKWYPVRLADDKALVSARASIPPVVPFQKKYGYKGGNK